MAFCVSSNKARNIFESSLKDCSAFLFQGEILMGVDGNWSAAYLNSEGRPRGYLDGKYLKKGKLSTRCAPGKAARVRREIKSSSFAMIGSLSDRIWGLP